MHPAERKADERAATGDIAGAERLLHEAAVADRNNAETWLKLGSARRALGDLAGASAAIDEVLRIEPLHFLGLMSRARIQEITGGKVEAARNYLRALAQLPDGAPVPAHLIPMVDHANRIGEEYRANVNNNWKDIANAQNDLDAEMRLRIDRFISNSMGRTHVYHCQPTHYHYPNLQESEFHSRKKFSWISELEKKTNDIRDEYLSMQKSGTGLANPYIQYDAGLPLRQWSSLNNSLDWTAFHLTQNGETIAHNAECCPVTMATLETIDQPSIVGRSPNAMFSVLKPHTHIPPHTGVANTRLVCHLPLIVPDGCWFRVGAERRIWREGEAFVFDDTIEHEAANESDLPRVVLIFDIWHPDLTCAERCTVAKLMEAGGLDEGAQL